MKKLSLDNTKKAILTAALKATANTMNKYMRRIYNDTAKQVEAEAGDRTMLTDAQVNIVKFALNDYENAHGKCAEVSNMLCQLTMTRKDYAKLMELA